MAIKLAIPSDDDVMRKLDEAVAAKKAPHSASLPPPMILVLRRKSVRQYPDGRGVAMYYADMLDKYIAIPYGADATPIDVE